MQHILKRAKASSQEKTFDFAVEETRSHPPKSVFKPWPKVSSNSATIASLTMMQ